ncbi:MAG: TIGR02186 family protein [Rhodospirillales bacterium]|nr:TIGR02186 family protein [Rhodospirillales bacterium]
MTNRFFLPFLAALGLIGFMLPPANAQSQTQPLHQDLVIDLSKSVVEISTGFAGSELLLFGVKNGPGDLVIVIKGPAGDEVVRRKERVAGVWVNKDEVTFTDVPSYYGIASSRPLNMFLNDKAASDNQIGEDKIKIKTKNNNKSAESLAEYHKALIRNKRKIGLYTDKPETISLIGNQLFKTQIRFPANVPVGTYDIKTYLVRDGNISSVDTNLLKVEKIGAEAVIYSFAHRHSLAYGVFAVLMALVTGWLASVFFRKA